MSSCEIHTVWRRCASSLVTRCCEFWKRRVWPLSCPRIFTSLSRRLWQFANILRGTGRIRMPSFGWFLSNRASTDWRVITSRSASCRPPGSTRAALRQLWSPKHDRKTRLPAPSDAYCERRNNTRSRHLKTHFYLELLSIQVSSSITGFRRTWLGGCRTPLQYVTTRYALFEKRILISFWH